MTNKTITIKWSELRYDAAANTWKVGSIAPREDGLHAETQMDDEGTDINLAKRSAITGTQQLAEALKRYVTNTTGAYTLTGVTNSTLWTLTLEVSTRNPSSETQLSALGHAYVLARICADWYKNMGDTTREKEWLDQQVDAETRLKSAIYKKVAPVLTT